MLTPKHARVTTFLCIACCIPVILVVYFLYPHRIANLAFPSLENKEDSVLSEIYTQATQSSTWTPPSTPIGLATRLTQPTQPTQTFQTSNSTSLSSSIDLIRQTTSPTPTPFPEGTYPLPEDDNTEDFLSAALGNPESSSADSEWVFNPETDGEDYGLRNAQCEAAFPQMYAELNRAVAYTHTEGNITIDDVDISWKESGVVRAMIYDRVLYIIEAKYGPEPGSLDMIRALAILGSIHRAITAYDGPIPNIEFAFSVEDIANFEDPGKWPLWALARSPEKEEQWVMPDFGFWAWDTDLVGTYEQVRQGIAEQEPLLLEKKPQAVWRGASLSNFNSIRTDLLGVTQGKEWADVREVVWEEERDEKTNHFIKIVDHCDYLFLIQTEGISYSGRLKYLLNCNSVSVIHKQEWIENFHHLLVAEGPNQNYIQVERNFTDLTEKIEFLLDRPDEIERIANNSIATFRDRYLTPAAQACYWRRLFWAWRSVSFEPQLYESVVTALDEEWNVTRTKIEWRGEPYQTYLMTTMRDLRPREPPKKKCGWMAKTLWLCTENP